MSYTDFLTLVKRNTSNKLDEYRELCRFCLKNQPDGIDISENSSNNIKQQRDAAILNNYNVLTSQYMPITEGYPKFVCPACEANLSHCALFAQQIQRNAENWELFLQSDLFLKNTNDAGEYINGFTDANRDEFALTANDIEIEFCDNERYYGNNVLDLPLLEIEIMHPASPANRISSATIAERKAKTAPTKQTYMNAASTEFERTCKHCDEPTFSSLARLYSHQKMMHPGIKISSCDICCAEFISKNALNTHMNDRHAKCGKKYQCQFCAKLFYSDREVKGHEKLHLNARSYVCNLCNRGFNQKTRLNVHMKSKIHNSDYKTKKCKPKNPQTNNSRKIYRCEQCIPSTVYSSSEERANHRNAMHKIYECDICKNSFITLESLESHKLLHSSKPRPYVCSVCDATFNQSSHLSSHFKRRHTDEKSFQCSFCNKRFFENCELNAHVNLVHRKQKRVKCGNCASDFASVKYLQKHILDKHSTDVSPYDCKVCGKKNGSGAKLEMHRLKHHSQDN